ncbi:MAG: ROK family protein [Clostridia bacterium]|nr:ROK family protein [Clostridia bacterium]
MRYYLGVDGGGTKTEAVVADENGKVVARTRVGSSNPNDVGKQNMIDMLCALVRDITPADAESIDVGMGLSGLAFAGCKDELISALKNVDKVGGVDVCSDVQIALDSAYDGEGCIAIVGTGGVGYLRKNGEHILVGGGGYMIDSLFSGYDLGREALNAALSETDGRGESTAITGLVLDKAGLPMNEIVKTVYTKGKAYVASFAPTVFAAYEDGDTVACQILKRRMAEFETLLWGIYKRYGAERCTVTLFGGLNGRVQGLAGFLSDEIKEKVAIELPKYPVVYGAVKRASGKADGAFLTAFLESY